MVAFLVVPQWQGSGSSRAMRLIDGAEAVRGDLPSALTTVLDVPAEAGESQGTGVDRITSICAIRDRMTDALSTLEAHGEPVIVVGGDCGVELPAVAHAVRRGRRTALVWFDAHPDLQLPAESASHAFHGMVLRTLLGDGDERLVPASSARVDPALLILGGARSCTDAEIDFVEARGIECVDASAMADPDVVLAALRSREIDDVYVHVDLDVLDPAEIEGIGFPEPFGVTAGQLVAAIQAVRAHYPLAGAAITEFAPSTPEAAALDMSVILRIVGALAGPRI